MPPPNQFPIGIHDAATPSIWTEVLLSFLVRHHDFQMRVEIKAGLR
jgi:hypothetical protein